MKKMRKMDKISEYLLYIFFASLIFSNTLAQGIAIILILIWLIKWLLTRRFINTPLDLPIIIYLFIRTVTCFTSINMMMSLRELRSGIFFSLIYFAITNLTNSEKRRTAIKRYIAILIYAGAVASLYAIANVFLSHFAVRAQSTAGGISRFSEYIMIVFCLSFSLMRSKDIFPRRYIAFVVTAIIGIGLIFAQARTQWFAIIPAIIVIGFMRERWFLLSIIAICGTLLAIIRNIRERFLTLIHPLSTSSFLCRLTIWKGASSLLFKRPFTGFGPRTYSLVSPFLKEMGSYHSDYLQIYMDSGIFGFLGYIYLSFMIFKESIGLCRDHSRREIGFALLFTLIAMYIVSFFGGHIQEPVITPLFFSLISFVSLMSIKKEN